MSVVKPETVCDAGHVLHVLRHVLPEVRRIGWALTESQFDVIGPDIDVSPQVVPAVDTEVLHAVPTANPAVMGNLRPLGIVELGKVGLNESVHGGNLREPELALEVSDVASKSSVRISHELSRSSVPVAIQLVEELLDFLGGLFPVSIVCEQEEHCSVWHLQGDVASLRARSHPCGKLVSNQVEVISQEPTSSLEDLFILLDFGLIDVLDSWHELLPHDLSNIAHEEFMHFEWLDDSLPERFHACLQIGLIPNEGSRRAFRNLFVGIIQGEILNHFIELPCAI